MIPNSGDDQRALPRPDDRPRGVFLVTPADLVQVHEYFGGGGDYGLEDVGELLGIGTVDRSGDWLRLCLSRSELKELKVAADAYSFDYPAELIEMCMDIIRGASAAPGESLEFLSNF